MTKIFDSLMAGEKVGSKCEVAYRGKKKKRGGEALEKLLENLKR